MYHFIKGKDVIICITFMSFAMQNLCRPIMFGHILQPDISKKKLWDFNVHISELICLSLFLWMSNTSEKCIAQSSWDRVYLG